MTIDLIPETLVFDKTKITNNADCLDTPEEQLVFVITKTVINSCLYGLKLQMQFKPVTCAYLQPRPLPMHS